MRRLCTFLHAALLATWVGSAHAAVLTVGPGETFLRIADAARHARDGDIVLIKAGTYEGDVAIWSQKDIQIRGVGGRPVLIAAGKSAEDKAIWVFRNGRVKVENIEFRGARVADGNGAGIRLERGELEVRDCVFEDNQHGILTANFPDTRLAIHDSVFAGAVAQQLPYPHLLYVGRIARLEISGSRFHRGAHGHLIKSRARVNDIRYNLIYDGPQGHASYELEFPMGGLATVVGNVIGQSADTENPVVVAYGAEADTSPWPENRLLLAHNTLVSERWKGAWFLRTFGERLPANTEVVAVNNLTVGPGVFSLGAEGRFRGNFPALSPILSGPEVLDFSLSIGTLLEGWADAAVLDAAAQPAAEFTLPIGTRPIAPPLKWSPGAFQSLR